MRKMLLIGDAACQTGFARSTHHLADTLKNYWDLSILGVNYRGDPHDYPYKIYPAALRNPGDWAGLKRLGEMLEVVRPDVVIIQNDPWNFPAYLKPLQNALTVGIVAVDGKNCRGYDLNGLALAVFWTEFARKEAIQGGYVGESAVVGLGVDRSIYHPQDRGEARAALGLGGRFDKAFIVGNVNRNQTRKRMDLTIQYFAEWVRGDKVDDAYLFLHVAPTGDDGYDCSQLAQYYGIESRLILSEPQVWNGPSEGRMAEIYSAFDVQLSTTQGEGWGLTTLEGMSCGIPQIAPRWSALGEWASGTAALVPCSTTAVTPGGINVIGGIPDREETIKALRSFYRSPNLRQEYSQMGISLASEAQFDWAVIGEKFNQQVETAVLYPTKVLETA